MKLQIAFTGTVEKFPGHGGWHYVVVPKQHTKELKAVRRTWGMFPITVTRSTNTWQTKLMTMKGGDYFVALKAAIRKKEKVDCGDVGKLEISLQ